MRTHLIENQTQLVMNRRFGCVRLTTFTKTSCAMNFLELTDKVPAQYFLLIDSKSQEVSINCENIESFTAQGTLMRLVYGVPQTDIFGYVKPALPLEQRNEEYECVDAADLLKTYEEIRKKLKKKPA